MDCVDLLAQDFVEGQEARLRAGAVSGPTITISVVLAIHLLLGISLPYGTKLTMRWFAAADFRSHPLDWLVPQAG